MRIDPPTAAAALELARMAVPTASERHLVGFAAPPLDEALARLEHPWRGPDGKDQPHAQCSRSGHPSPLARLVDPVDRLDPTCDPLHLVTARRRADHAARVLALAAAGTPRGEQPLPSSEVANRQADREHPATTRTTTATEPPPGGEDDDVAPTAATPTERLAVVRDDLASGIDAVKADAVAGGRRLTRDERNLLAAANALLGAVDGELQRDVDR